MRSMTLEHGMKALLAASACCALFFSAAGAQAGELDASLVVATRMSAQGAMRVIVELEGEKPITAYAAALQPLPRNARPGKLKSLLLADYQAAARGLTPRLAALKVREVQPLWIKHSMLVEAQRGQLAALAALPGVKRVSSDISLRSAQRSGMNLLPIAKERALAEAAQGADKSPAPKRPIAPMMPYHSALEALDKGEALSLPPHYLALDVLAAWGSGARGKGVTVAIVDSGVDSRSTSIAQGFRAQPHDWFDPYGERKSPTDFEGHGTYVAGLLVGDVVSSRATPVESVPVGIAPEAKWIASRIFDDGGRGSISAILRIYQWLLDPDDKPDTPDAPDIVNNSWGLPQTAGHCDLTMVRAIEALRAADMHVVFAAGNDGPTPNTSLSPANNPGVLSVGALHGPREASRRSSRGPSACGKAVYPAVWTAGDRLPALDKLAASAGTTGQADGSSFAAAAVSGALAVLRSAAPQASSQAVEDALLKSVPAVSQAEAYVSPQLPAALAQLTGKPVAPGSRLLRLRWQPTLSSAQDMSLNAASLSKVLPWEDSVTSMSGEGLKPSGKEAWSLAVADGKAVQLRAKAASGREYAIELIPRMEMQASASSASAARLAPVRTSMNTPVLITLSAQASESETKNLRVSSPTRGGRLKLMDKAQVEYTPPKGFVGTDQFTFTLPTADGKPGPNTIVTVLVVRS